MPTLNRRKLDIEYLYLDLEVCGRCIGTDENIDAALREVSGILESAGIEVTVSKIHVETELQAEALGFETSPTVRIDGRDIALGLRESRCEDCEICAGVGPVNCRAWFFGDQVFDVAPKAMIVDAILRSVYGGSGRAEAAPRPPKPVSDNLRRFFTGKSEKRSNGSSGCCTDAESLSCCDESQKALCCETKETGDCACR